MQHLHRHLMFAFAVTSATSVAVLACGETLSTADHACPCETGWTCCTDDNVCVPPGGSCGNSDAAASSQCPQGITIGMSSVPTFGPDGSAEPFPNGLSMTGQVIGTFPMGGDTVPFDYAQSTTLVGGVMQEQGWIVSGGNTLAYRFDVYATDGHTQRGLQLAVYGPIEIGFQNNQCFAPLVDNSPLAAGSGVFDPPAWGKYFVTAYHPIEIASNGSITVQAYGDPSYSNAVFSLQPMGD
jgi:hypothetical protein